MSFTDKNIIFIFSLPRSGSTLLQRILGTNQKICTSSESWLLLPSLYFYENNSNCISEYDYDTSKRAVNEFLIDIDGGSHKYRKGLANLSVETFSRACSNDDSLFFLEKTPRNNLIIDQVLELFPNSKVIFLWRDPVSIVSSIVETFCLSKWKLQYYEIDLYKGLENMLNAFDKHKDRVFSVKYEDLVSEPKKTVQGISDYLEINFLEDDISSFFETKLNGTLGDKAGIKTYKDINEAPIDKWKNTICNPIRVRWVKKYLNWIGEERLRVMGYEMKELQSNLNNTPLSYKYIGSDFTRTVYSFINVVFSLRLTRKKLRAMFRKIKVYDYR